MALNTPQYLEQFHDQTQALGADAVTSDFTLEIIGAESLYLRTKGFPIPTTASQGTIEIPLPLGGQRGEAVQNKTYFTGSVTFMETVDAYVRNTIARIATVGIAGGAAGYFDAWAYHGDPQNYTYRMYLRHAHIALSAGTQTDMSSNTEVLLIEGDISYHYYGRQEIGNRKLLSGY